MKLLATAGISLGAGVGGRALIGLNSLLGNSQPDPLMHSSPVPTPLPIRVQKKKRPEELGLKAAHATTVPAAPADTLQRGANMLPDINTAGPLSDWWGPPAALATAGAGLFGGWKLTDWLLRNQKEKELSGDLANSEEEYQKAMREQYLAAMRAKSAGDDFGIGDLYDRLQEKQAQPTASPSIGDIADAPLLFHRMLAGDDNVQLAKGILGAAMLGTAAGTGYITYDYAKSRNKQKLMEKAIQLRARQRQFSPTPFYAAPEYTDLTNNAT